MVVGLRLFVIVSAVPVATGIDAFAVSGSTKPAPVTDTVLFILAAVPSGANLLGLAEKSITAFPPAGTLMPVIVRGD